MEKIKSMKKYNRVHQFLYNIVLYSLTSLITLLFFTYPLWIPFMNNFILSFPDNISFFFNAKCLFILGNIIILILVGESRLRQPPSSPASEIYDEYVARSRKLRSQTNILAIKYIEPVQKLDDNLQYEAKKEKVVRVSKRLNQREEKKGGLRGSKSEVWGRSGMLKSEENLNNQKKKDMHGEKKRGLRASKSQVWGENEIPSKDKLHDEEKHEHEEKKTLGLRVSKRGENDIVKTEEHVEEEKKKEEKKGGLKASKSEVWGESGIVLKERAKEKKEEVPMATEELNTRVEAFIARVNKQRMFEAKLLQDGT